MPRACHFSNLMRRAQSRRFLAELAATSAGRRGSVDVDHAHAGELAHPGELAARVVARAALHRLDVPGQQLLEAERLARRLRGAGRVRAPHLLAHAPPRASPRRARRSARTARRAPSSARRAASGGAARRSTAATRSPRRRLELAGVEQLERAHDALAVVRVDPAAAHGARRASTACSAGAPRAQLGRPVLAHALGGGGRRSSSVSAARRYRPVPPTTIGRRPARAAVDLGVRELGVLPDAERRVERQERDQPVLELRALGGEATPVSVSRPAVHLQRVGGHGHRVLAARAQPLASATATAVLPTPVGPNTRRSARPRASGIADSARGQRDGQYRGARRQLAASRCAPACRSLGASVR